MEDVISRSKSLQPDYRYVEKKMRLILDWAEEEAKFYAKQGAFLYQLSVQTVPKSLHCLSMRLTAESFKNLRVDAENSHAERLNNPDLLHYVIFSKNVLASSVVINSTVTSAEVTNHLIINVHTSFADVPRHCFHKLIYLPSSGSFYPLLLQFPFSGHQN